jgi:uncharacterized protein involved in cysteine biosynthesis
MMNNFFFGMSAVFRGFLVLASSSKLRNWSLVPFLIAILLGSLITIFGLYLVASSIGAVAIQLSSWLSLSPGSWITAAITLLMWPIALLLLGVLVYVGVRLIVAPFYSILAEISLVELGLCENKPWQGRQWLKFTLRMLAVSILKSFIFAIGTAILFVCSLIPLLNLFAAVGFILMLSFDLSDYSFEAMGWGLRRRFHHFRANWPLYSGFAVSLGMLLVIPGMGIITLPAAVIGGSLILQRSISIHSEGSGKSMRD